MGARLMTLGALLLLPASAPAAQAPIVGKADFDPAERVDARDVAGDPLDVRAVTFGQRGTRLLLSVRTQAPWTASSLRPNALCLSITRGAEDLVRRLCIGTRRGTAVLTYQRNRGRGFGPTRVLRAPVVRGSQSSMDVTFSPRAIDLPRGKLRWSVQSRWYSKGACATGCIDRLPDRGEARATVKVLAQPRCFGAAARDPERRCSNPALARTLIPTPEEALLDPPAPCQPIGPRAVARPCEFGYREGSGPPDVLLIGDSHTNSLRGAVDVAAHARGWRAMSMTRGGCALSAEVYPSPAPGPAQCHRRNADALRWLARHPSVHTVFTSASAGRGFSPSGFAAMFNRIPRTVRRIYVIRDVPRVRFATLACVRSISKKHLRTAGVCAVPRSSAILSDPAFAAAQAGPARVRAVDLTRYFCDRARCYPVIGGAFVYVDDNHINATFATTLGPFLLRQLG